MGNLKASQNGAVNSPSARIRAFLRPSAASLARTNRPSNFAFMVLMACGGSAASLTAVLFACWALISLALGRFRFRLERSDWPIVFSSLAFMAVLVLGIVLRAPTYGDLLLVLPLLTFLIPVFLVPRMRVEPAATMLTPAFAGAAVGGCVLFAVVWTEYAITGERVEGLSGNQGPLAIAGLLTAGLSGLYLFRARTLWLRPVALLGMAGGASAVILSGMRGSWPALPVCLAIVAYARRDRLRRSWREAGPRLRWLSLAASAAAILAFAAAAWPLVEAQFRRTLMHLTLWDTRPAVETSLSMRGDMYEAAAQAIAEAPVFGHGIQNRWAAVEPYLDLPVFDDRTFSHLHDIFLTVAVDAGAVGLLVLVALVAAPLWTAWRARRSVDGADRLAFAGILVVAFLIPGMTNIMFFHDILDAVWVYSISLIAASVPARSPAGAIEERPT